MRLSKIVFICIYLLFTTASFAQQEVSIRIVMDMSDTITKFKAGFLAELIPSLQKKLNKQCRYNIAVGGIKYSDKSSKPYLKPFYNPDLFEPAYITPDTYQGRDLLRNRIMNPVLAVGGADTERGKAVFSSVGGQELTFSSVTESILYDLEAGYFEGKSVVSALLITDAVPEIENPLNHLQMIRDHLGNRVFVAGVLAFDFEKWGPSGFSEGGCPADTSVSGSPLTYSYDAGTKKFVSYVRSDRMYRLHQFAQESGGWLWDICSPSEYEKAIEHYIQILLMKAGCLQLIVYDDEAQLNIKFS